MLRKLKKLALDFIYEIACNIDHIDGITIIVRIFITWVFVFSLSYEFISRELSYDIKYHQLTLLFYLIITLLCVVSTFLYIIFFSSKIRRYFEEKKIYGGSIPSSSITKKVVKLPLWFNIKCSIYRALVKIADYCIDFNFMFKYTLFMVLCYFVYKYSFYELTILDAHRNIEIDLYKDVDFIIEALRFSISVSITSLLIIRIFALLIIWVWNKLSWLYEKLSKFLP